MSARRPSRRSLAKQLREIKRRREQLLDVTAAVSRLIIFVGEHGEADRDDMVERLERYAHIVVDELTHVCTEGHRINAELGLVEHQWLYAVPTP